MIFLSEDGLADPGITSFVWSPDSAELAVDHTQGDIQIVPVRAGGPVPTLQADGLLVGWGP